jgi:aspartyl-tRNA(Asn)/glutamyl-tRNA(Gln) amidotransferase subunit C
MKLDLQTVEKLAELAKLEFSEQEKAELLNDLNRILEFMDKLNELDTTGVEPLVYMNDEVNVLRADEVIQELTHEEALLNAPKKDSDYFRVPKVLEK